MIKTKSFIFKDYKEAYKPIMQFNKNKIAFIHQWYPFVEGYSKEFIKSIIEEIDYKPNLALDPFAGSGTTPVELQDLGIKCYSFEVSPFMHLLASVKLEQNYKLSEFNDALITVGIFLQKPPENIRSLISPPLAKTFQPKNLLEKWVFNKSVMDGILDIKYAINLIQDSKYRDLLRIALCSILLDVSNVYRNGKCLSYKVEWKKHKLHRKTVHKKFLDKLTRVFLPDIEIIESNKYSVDNKSLCILGDVREKISELKNKSIDLLITSPPYLNSRDYTDIYIVELWMLDLLNEYPDIKNLREKTIRSHVQVKRDEIETLEIPELKKVLKELNKKKNEFWSIELPTMIKGYFKDMDTLFAQLKLKMQPNRKLFFNVANSAYYGVEIKVDEIVSTIAETHGFTINEIREARQLKPSSQQKEKIKSLRESVIVMTSSV